MRWLLPPPTTWPSIVVFLPYRGNRTPKLDYLLSIDLFLLHHLQAVPFSSCVVILGERMLFVK